MDGEDELILAISTSEGIKLSTLSIGSKVHSCYGSVENGIYKPYFSLMPWLGKDSVILLERSQHGYIPVELILQVTKENTVEIDKLY